MILPSLRSRCSRSRASASWVGLGRLGHLGPHRAPITRLERLEQVAELYAEGSAAGSRRLNAEVAEALGQTPAQVRDDVYAARRREGLLTDGPGRGRSGGSLTPKARAIPDGLRASGEDHGP